jgi:hypothetical protein
MESKHNDLLIRFEQGYFESEDIENLKNALNSFKG